MSSDGYFDVDRRSELWMNLPNTVLGRHGWTLQRSARQIRQQREIYKSFFGGIFNAGKVLNVAGDAWIIQPYGHDPAEWLTTQGEAHVTADDVNLAPNHRAYYTYRKTSTPGAGLSSDLLLQSGSAFQRRRAAGASLADGNLDADLVALPAPVDPLNPPFTDTFFTPMDRVVGPKVDYPANQPYFLSFQCVSGSQDTVARFYFGGSTAVVPAGQTGGYFCVTLRGNGLATLHEFDGETFAWVPVYEFAWGHKHAGGNFNGLIENNNLYVVPYARDRIAFYNLGYGYAGVPPGGMGMINLLQTLAIQGISMIQDHGMPVPIKLFRHHSDTDDHSHVASMTGAGPIRMDRPRTDRLPFSIIHSKYRESAFLVDAPFQIDVGELPLATPMTLTINGWTPPGTSIVPTIYDGTTGIAVLRSGNLWLTNLGQRVYFVKFEFKSDGDPDATPPVAAGEQTPVLFSYTISLPPAFETVEATPIVTGRLKSLAITGPGTSPTEENASVLVQDEADQASILRVRDQMRSKIVIVNRATGVPISVLFEGQTASPEAALRGFQDGEAYPSASWHETDARFTGMWPRLFRQFHAGAPFDFTSSEDSPHPLSGPFAGSIWAPWCLTDVLRWAANRCGVPDSQLDIPHSPLRLPADKTVTQEQWAVWPGTPYGKFLEEISRDFLGQIWMRDPNCGAIDSSGLPTGMWRLLPNPSLSSTNYLFVISLDKPPVSGTPYFPMSEGALGAGVYPALPGSWKTRPKAAEGNVFITRGMAMRGSDDGPGLLTSDPLVNPAGFDPSSPDYLEGETVRVVRVFEGFAVNKEALQWAARILYQRAAFAEKWWQVAIPCPLVTDPLDPVQVWPRCPRINDLCLIRRGGVDYPAVVRSANPGWSNDMWPTLHLEGKFRDPAYVLES